MYKVTDVLKTAIESGEGIKDIHPGNEELQLMAFENRRKPGSVIFVRKDGKVGFPTINSISFDIGDVVKGTLYTDFTNYFWIEVTSIVKKKDKEQSPS